MKKLSNATKAILIGLGIIILDLILHTAVLLCIGILTVVIAGIIQGHNYIDKLLEKSGQTYFLSFKIIIIVGYLLITALSVIGFGFMAQWDFRLGALLAVIIMCMLFSILLTYVYFLPYLVANKQNHRQTHAIYVLNIFAGWTIVAWVIALIWAYTDPSEKTVIEQKVTQSDADELRKYKELLDQQIITEEEFIEKKKQILGIENSK